MTGRWLVPLRAAKRLAAPFVPRPAKRALAGIYGAAASHSVSRRLRRIARAPRPIIIGPWLSEVGFELLYWVPFVRWAAHEFGLAPERCIVVSRGGTASWYAGLASGYVDLFELYDLDTFADRNRRRAARTLGQKQMVATVFDQEIVDRVCTLEDLEDPCLLHPALMYNLLRPYWWDLADSGWARRRAIHTGISVAAPPETERSGITAKFYFSECLPQTRRNTEYIDALLRDLDDERGVSLLTTGFVIDDHREHAAASGAATRGRPTSVAPASSNLAVQTSTIAGSRAFVGTYGGFAYLPPFLGVDAHAIYSNRAGFLETHLALAREVFERERLGALRLYDMNEVTPGEVAAAVRESASTTPGER